MSSQEERQSHEDTWNGVERRSAPYVEYRRRFCIPVHAVILLVTAAGVIEGMNRVADYATNYVQAELLKGIVLFVTFMLMVITFVLVQHSLYTNVTVYPIKGKVVQSSQGDQESKKATE